MIENPFSGMNPYLEQRWGDVHTGLVTYGRAMIQDSLPPELRARMQERVFIEMDLKERAYYPDVLDYERPGETSRRPPSAGTAAVVAEPLLIRLPGVEI